MSISAPSSIFFSEIDPYSVELRWYGVEGAKSYIVRINEDTIGDDIASTSMVVRGLLPASEFTATICSVGEHGVKSSWNSFTHRTGFPIRFSSKNSYTISPIPGYRQKLIAELPDIEGVVRRCGIIFWWQPSDAGWWGSLEVPVETLAVSGKRLGLNCGILDNDYGVLRGNIVMRTLLSDPIEPDLDCFKNRTHELRWEPY